MGFGHRVYKTYDPRAKIFKYYSEKLSKNNSQANIYYKIASKLEEIGIKNFSDKKYILILTFIQEYYFTA